MRIKMIYKEIKENIQKLGFNLISKEYKDNKQNLELEKDGYKYWSSYNRLSRGYKPQRFSIHNPFTLYNIKLWLNKNNSRTEPLRVFQKKDKLYITAKCMCGNVYECSFSNFYRKQYKHCPKCGVKTRVEESKISFQELKSIVSQKGFQFVNETKYSMKGRYAFKDKKGYIVITSVDAIKRNVGVSKFHTSNPYTIYNIKNFIRLNNIDCEIISTEYVSKDSPLCFKCRCGNLFHTSWHHFKKDSLRICPKCAKIQSAGETAITNFLKQLNIKSIAQFSFKDCKYKNPLRFDFYLPAFNACIEFNGIQHYKSLEFFGGLETFQYQQIRDNIKKQYCLQNKILFIEIPYTSLKNKEYKKIISHKLNLSK